MHVADGDVKRASRFAFKVVPPGDVDRKRLRLSQTGLAGVEAAEELRQLVHQLEPENRQNLSTPLKHVYFWTTSRTFDPELGQAAAYTQV